MVLAGPGAGKTFTIIHRILYLICCKNVPPEKILVLTFTREAALSMQNRYAEICNRYFGNDTPDTVELPVLFPQQFSSVNFGTFHSVFYQILKRSGNIRDQQILTEKQKKQLMVKLLTNISPKSSKISRENGAADILAAIAYYKNASCLDKALDKVPVEFRDSFTQIFETYEMHRRKQGKLDFDDMLLDCKALLEKDDSVRHFWQERFSTILMDEFQDINPVQYQVIKLLTAPPYSLFAVGDDDQSIYGFRGSQPACMKQFKEEFRAETILLDLNYRSGDVLVKAFQAVISDNYDRFFKSYKAGTQKESSITLLPFQNQQEEGAYLLKLCREQTDTAVLFRTNRLMQQFASMLRKNRIPFLMKEGGKNIYDYEVVLDIMAYLQLAHNGICRDLLARIINRPTRYIKREVVNSAFEHSGPEEPFTELMNRYQQISQENTDRLCLLKKQLEKLRSLTPYLGIQYIRHIIGYEKWLKEQYKDNPDKAEEAKEIMEWLLRDASMFSDFDDYQRHQQKSRTEEPYTKDSIPFLKLMTVHASKGLEFDRVLLPDCNERIFPYGQLLDTNTLEEERRIFYVAMTRARNSLELCYVNDTGGKNKTKSRFLNIKLEKITQKRKDS